MPLKIEFFLKKPNQQGNQQVYARMQAEGFKAVVATPMFAENRHGLIENSTELQEPALEERKRLTTAYLELNQFNDN